MHGKYMTLESDRFEVMENLRRPVSMFEPELYLRPCDTAQTLTYTVRRYRRTVGDREGRFAVQQVSIALLDGMCLTPSEERDLDHEVRGERWGWGQPNILYDFEQWWRWVAYKHNVLPKHEQSLIQDFGPFYDERYN